MDVNLIFKIAAVGILVSVLSQVLKHSGQGRTGIFNKLCRTFACIVLDRAIHLPVVSEYPAVILPVGKKGAYEYHTDLRSCCCRYASCCAV